MTTNNTNERPVETAAASEDLGRTSIPASPEIPTQAIQTTPPVHAVQETHPKEIMVRIARIGAPVMEIHGPQGMTVKEAIEKSGVNAQGMSTRVMNTPVLGEYQLHNGDDIMLIPNIEGGDLI